MNKIRVLYVTSDLGVTNGMSSYAMNYFRHLDHEKVKIDFLVSKDVDSPYIEEIKGRGSKIFVLPKLSLRNIMLFIKTLDNFFEMNRDYDIIHCHVANLGLFYLKAAKKYNIPIRILHSHITKGSDKFLRRIRNDLMLPFTRRLANVYFACTDDAGRYMFKDKPFTIIQNAITLEKFSYKEDIRNKLRKKLYIQDKIVIGTVGRFTNQKNPLFTLDIFNNICQKRDDVVLLLIGSGPLENEIVKKIKRLSLDEKVIILKDISDVENYYQVMDCFLLPSVYEGLGIVFIESQVSGLYTFGSDVLPIETKITDNIQYLSLSLDANSWSEEILKKGINQDRIIEASVFRKSGYDIKVEAKRLNEIYQDLVAKNIH